MTTLYNKYRPTKFSDVIYQDFIVKQLVNQLNNPTHAHLFYGPHGTGKTTLARLFAMALNCLEDSKQCGGKCKNCEEIIEGSLPDVIEIDGATHSSVDDARKLKDVVNQVKQFGKYRVIIIDEAHSLSKPALNALLKVLEEPPPNTVFCLCTTELDKIILTIRSRCAQHQLKRIPPHLIKRHLKDIIEKENKKVTEEIIDLVVDKSGGSMRDALHSSILLAGMDYGVETREVALREILAVEWSEVLHVVRIIRGEQAIGTLTSIFVNENFLWEVINIFRQDLSNKSRGVSIQDCGFILRELFELMKLIKLETEPFIVFTLLQLSLIKIRENINTYELQEDF